jgi:hypothetical protein
MSDQTAKFEGVYEQAKKRRREAKEEKGIYISCSIIPPFLFIIHLLFVEEVYQKVLAKVTENGKAGMEAKKESAPAVPMHGYGYPGYGFTAPQPAPQPQQIPDELLPPHNILFVQNIPDSTPVETLEGLFKR